jgi:hypothetical protein
MKVILTFRITILLFIPVYVNLSPLSVQVGHKKPRIYENVSKSFDNEIYAYNNKHSFRSNTKGYGVETH